MSGVDISSSAYVILASLIEDKLGLHYRDEDRDILASKLAEGVAAAGFRSALDYYYLLRYDDPRGEELQRLAQLLLVGETYFFREVSALQSAVTHVIVPAIESAGRARVLCAGCSTGEEPFTLAMLLAERGVLDACDVVGVDANARAIQHARRGVYGKRSLRALPQAAARWFTTTSDGAAIDPALRDHVRFLHLNLLDEGAVAALGTFDLVLCRNVLIYFRDETIRRVVNALANVLEPRGRLLVGASESLLRLGTRFTCEERGDAFFYRASAS